MSTTVTADIEVDVPVRVAYDQWTQFESFPHFMSGVESVRQIDDTTTHWVVSIAGVKREFDADISDDGQKVAYSFYWQYWTMSGSTGYHMLRQGVGISRGSGPSSRPAKSSGHWCRFSWLRVAASNRLPSSPSHQTAGTCSKGICGVCQVHWKNSAA